MEARQVSLGALLVCAQLLGWLAPAIAVFEASSKQINDSRSLSGFADHSSLAEAINIQLEDSVKLVPTSGGRLMPASSLIASKQPATSGTVARLPRRLKSSNLPQLTPMSNVSAVVGRDVRLVCIVEHLGQYQVAWLKEETHTILSIDTNIIITNYRIFLIPDTEERKWVLHIKDVQESDRGFYQCQVNTNPMRSTRGYLEVNVPPTIIESQSSQLAEVLEHGDVNIQCKASGHPKPVVTWRRDDDFPIRIHNKFIGPTSDNPNQDNSQLQPLDQKSAYPGNSPMMSELSYIRSDRLSLFDADKQMSGNYVCTASNGIPPQAIKRIPLYVKFPAKVTLESAIVVVGLGDQVEVDCTIEAYPMANSSWIRSAYGYSNHKLSVNEDWIDSTGNSMDRFRNHPRLDTYRNNQQNHQHQARHLPRLKSEVRFSGATSNLTDILKDIRGHFTVHRIAISPNSYKIRMIIYKVQPTDLGQYTCTASNVLGDAQAHLTLTRREKTDEKNVDKNYQQDASPSIQKNTRVNTPLRPNVFDENYLNSIQLHQKNKETFNRWRSKYSKNSNSAGQSKPSLITVITLVIMWLLWFRVGI